LFFAIVVLTGSAQHVESFLSVPCSKFPLPGEDEKTVSWPPGITRCLCHRSGAARKRLVPLILHRDGDQIGPIGASAIPFLKLVEAAKLEVYEGRPTDVLDAQRKG
jgi:hypothetical protein